MKTVVLLSGGLDSSTLLYLMRRDSEEVTALSVLYGQRHARELLAARAVAKAAQVPHKIADLREASAIFAGSALTSPEVPVPHGHYEEESMKATVVPNRNMVLISLATALAISLKYGEVAYAAHAGDHAIYPDCRASFVVAMGTACRLCDWSPVRLRAPFLGQTKKDIVRLGAELGVPFGLTYSCYEGEEFHCGCCGTCVERREAFALAGVADPTAYRGVLLPLGLM